MQMAADVEQKHMKWKESYIKQSAQLDLEAELVSAFLARIEATEPRLHAYITILAEDAMDALDGRMYDGRDLRIQMAKYGRPDINRYISSILEFFSNEAVRTGRKEYYFCLSNVLI